MRLVTLNIDPIFVFDGPNKPAFKRNKRSRGPGDTVSKAMAQRVMRFFDFAIHDAPGEAEAECALLQREGIVDAVLSEDVDTIMFGCTRTLRNWSAEGRKGAQTPTHVSVYDAAEMRQGETGLGREGLVLVALMSGGDYITEGVPGCGVKVACEAAKAGFGTRLCRIKRPDTAALQGWKDDLMRELRTNESKFFRVKHKALTIPEQFPDFEVLRYYTHPVVSDAVTIERVKRQFPSKREIDVAGLRAFTAEIFDWTYKPGALKFIKVLAPGLLVHALMALSDQSIYSQSREELESNLVKAISLRRLHFSTDGTPELRISYIPNGVVGVNLDEEEEVDEDAVATFGRSGLALNSDDDDYDEVNGHYEDGSSRAKAISKKVYDPLQPDLCWVPETIVKLGIPLIVEDWEAHQRMKELIKERKSQAKATRKAKVPFSMPHGSLDKYVQVTKASGTSTSPTKGTDIPSSTFLSLSQLPSPSRQTPMSQLKRPTRTSRSKVQTPAQQLSVDVNPWSITNPQITPKPARTTRTAENRDRNADLEDPILISSSPRTASPASPSPVSAPRPRFHMPPLLDLDDDKNDDDDMVAMDNYLKNRNTQPPFSTSSAASRATSRLNSPQKHDQSSREPSAKPPAKRLLRQEQKPSSASSCAATITMTTSAGAASFIRTATTSTKRSNPNTTGTPKSSTSARATTKGAPHKSTQHSIKNFGRLSKGITTTTSDVSTRSAAKLSSSVFNKLSDDDDEDDDEEFEDVRDFGSKKPLNLTKAYRKTQPPLAAAAMRSTAQLRNASSVKLTAATTTTCTTTAVNSPIFSTPSRTRYSSPIELPSSSPLSSFSPPLPTATAPSLTRPSPHITSRPFPNRTATGTSKLPSSLTTTTIIYTGDVKAGYFTGRQVTMEEADRMMREDQKWQRQEQEQKRDVAFSASILQEQEEEKKGVNDHLTQRRTTTAGTWNDNRRLMWRQSDVSILDLTGEI